MSQAKSADPSPRGHAAPAPATDVPRRFDRLLQVTLGALVLLVLHTWLLRLGDDLSWDETYNYRVYARHPLTALALYWEPNNHVAESLFKSLFHWGLGLQGPEFLKLPGLIVLAGYLGVAWAWWGLLWRPGSRLAAAAAVVLFFTARAAADQALVLRGYFPSLALALYYLLRVAREAGWIGPAGAPPCGEARRSIRMVGPESALCALLLWIVPSNALLMPALWGGSILAAGSDHDGRAARRNLRRMMIGTLTLAGLLYSPVAFGFLIGFNRLGSVPGGAPPGPLMAMLSEPWRLGRLAGPAGFAAGFAVCGLALILIPMLFPAVRAADRRQGRGGAAVGALSLAVLTILPAGLLAAFSTSPPRVLSPLAAPLWVAVILALHGLERRLPPRIPILLALACAGIGFVSFRSIAAGTVMARDSTRAAAILGSRFEGRADRVLICCQSQPLYLPLIRDFRPDLVVSGPLEIDLAFRGEGHGSELARRPLARALRRAILPPRPAGGARVEDIEAVVFVIDDAEGRDPRRWRHEVLDQILVRLPVRSECGSGRYRFEIHEGPLP